jgi:chorismate dehydratase
MSGDRVETPRIGAVCYLNARPLIYALSRFLPGADVRVDLPSRLADDLAADRLDVALVPSIEHLRHPEYRVVSDACVACDGPVQSIRLYGRVVPERIRTLALDEGSRTSVMLARILLKEQVGIEPAVEALPIGATIEETSADAVMLIGDRGMRPADGQYAFVWDLGERWTAWTGLPMVFALWLSPADKEVPGLAQGLAAARDEGLRRLPEIARQAAPEIGIPEADCLTYLRDHIRFRLDERARQGLQRFYGLASRHGLVPGQPEPGRETARGGA